VEPTLAQLVEAVTAFMNELTPGLSVLIAMGVGIGTAFGILVFIGKQIEWAFDYSDARKSKDEEEKPKRKAKNDELVFSDEAIDERMQELHGIGDDGEMIFITFEDEEMNVRGR
jgi:hypothetical protein